MGRQIGPFPASYRVPGIGRPILAQIHLVRVYILGCFSSVRYRNGCTTESNLIAVIAGTHGLFDTVGYYIITFSWLHIIRPVQRSQ